MNMAGADFGALDKLLNQPDDCPLPNGGQPVAGAQGPGAIKAPMGKAMPNAYLEQNLERLKAENRAKAPALLYNEFIVYDVRQIRMKYVVVVDLDFKESIDLT